MIMHAALLQETSCYVVTRTSFLEVMSHADPTPSPSSSSTTPGASFLRSSSGQMKSPLLPPIDHSP